MRHSRRSFLGAAAVAPLLTGHDWRPFGSKILDLGCVLPESLAGFKQQAGDLPPADTDAAEVLIIPRVGPIAHDGLLTIERCLARGGTVLLESGLGVPIHQAAYFPYVDYMWPIKVKIREFAPVGLEPAPGDQIIGALAGTPVALRRRVGQGTLVTLGSALGPIFMAGDPDARRWLGMLHTS